MCNVPSLALADFVWSPIHLNAAYAFHQLAFVPAYCYFSEALCTTVTFQHIILEDKGSILIPVDNFSVIFQFAQKNRAGVGVGEYSQIQPNPDIAPLFRGFSTVFVD